MIFYVETLGNDFIFLPDHVVNEIIKEFCQDSHFENMKADFLLRRQNTLW